MRLMWHWAPRGVKAEAAPRLQSLESGLSPLSLIEQAISPETAWP
jgi:hypothetical protein